MFHAVSVNRLSWFATRSKLGFLIDFYRPRTSSFQIARRNSSEKSYYSAIRTFCSSSSVEFSSGKQSIMAEGGSAGPLGGEEDRLRLLENLRTAVNATNWQPLGKVDALSAKRCTKFYSKQSGQDDLALFYHHDKFYAMDATCPHEGKRSTCMCFHACVWPGFLDLVAITLDTSLILPLTVV